MNFQRFEHINLSCRDINATRQFYQTLFPDWYVRAEGAGWLHLGNDRFYLSLMQEASQTPRNHQSYYSIGINHVGFVIQDGGAMQATLDNHGIEYSLMDDAPETRFRAYLYDPDGNELELIEYQSSYALK